MKKVTEFTWHYEKIGLTGSMITRQKFVSLMLVGGVGLYAGLIGDVRSQSRRRYVSGSIRVKPADGARNTSRFREFCLTLRFESVAQALGVMYGRRQAFVLYQQS